MKYLGYIIKIVPYLIINYWKIFKNAVFKNKISSVKRYREIRKIVTKVNKDLKIELIVSGNKELPVTQSFMMTPNHQSFMDSLVLVQFMEQESTFVAKKEAKKYIFVGKVLESLDGLFLDRDNLRQEIKVMQDVKKSLKNDNKKWIIFPEGTRTKDENFKVGEFKAGSLKMAMSSQVDIYPVALWGSFKVLSLKYNQKKFPIFIHVFDPIKPEFYNNMKTTELAPYIQDMVSKKVDEFKALDEKYVSELKNKKLK